MAQDMEYHAPGSWRRSNPVESTAETTPFERGEVREIAEALNILPPELRQKLLGTLAYAASLGDAMFQLTFGDKRKEEFKTEILTDTARRLQIEDPTDPYIHSSLRRGLVSLSFLSHDLGNS